MLPKRVRKEKQHTTPDHCPMIPVLCGPSDVLDAAIRDNRRCYALLDPKEYLNWR